MKFLVITLAALALIGCKKEPEVVTPPATGVSSSDQHPASSGNGSDIAPMASSPIPNAPVSEGENMGGGGGGVQQALKDKARQVAGSPNTASSAAGSEGGDGG